ncbi:hypothetical protein C7974DRAFT_311994 [Boeremia exigua]|uniref:uncharacterized protein n=1 Tax=Boeremia exigua TaxID=749465 RepID=UPI001E8EE022|nr:uncharacterized protein C7974DRAFT_311994 [Boeremia exigua]KAH6628983.1 hypothetical protein C7974DRAFT_311994 [Boeremia exigua]
MSSPLEVDALVVGAGVGGIYSTYCLTRLGLSTNCIDIAGDVGGTWYFNRYPGAMSDTESYLYRYSWDKDDLQTYPWQKHYLYQAEILAYLKHIVKKHELRQYMQFNTEMTSAVWNECTQRWRITCSTGLVVDARYLVNSLGLLSKVHYPPIAGISTYKGKLVHTARWDEDLDVKGKTVGIIGNGSTGVQVMTALAPIAGRLTSFQRHPQYSVPSGQGLIPEDYRAKINGEYNDIWKGVFTSSTGFGVPESTRKAMEATPEEREKAFQDVWDQGNGFRFMFSAFGDITTDRAANEEACAFIRRKISSIVTDPRKANILKPKDLYARRPLCDSGYYQIFNRDNVDIVDLQATPIQEIVPEGVQLADGTIHKLDVLIFATGFDAIEGNYTRVRIIGRDGKSIKDHWQHGPTAYGGIACAGFPNMYVVAGPQGPFANFPPVIESEVNFIISCIERAEASRCVLEVTHEAERGWVALCDELVQGSLFRTAASWIFGQNVAGRQASTNFFFGGLKGYLDWVKTTVTEGFVGFEHRPWKTISKSPQVVDP